MLTIQRFLPGFLLFLLPYLLSAQTIYPAPAGLKPSADYRVFVNGQEAFVYASPIPAAWCSFEMNGPVEVTIQTARDVKWADVRPFSARITPTFSGKTIRFRIDKPRQLSIELNGSLRTPLFLFANASETRKPARSDKNVLYFEAGKIHYPGRIDLKSDQTVYIEGGAVVVGVIQAKDARNVRIAGRGVLDGTYNRQFNEEIIKTGDTARIHANKTGRYARFIELDGCENATVEGVTLFNGTSWQLVPINCKNVLIQDVKIVSDNASDDGIDVVHSQNVRIENSFIRTKDDCIVLKAYMKKTSTPGVDSVLVQSPATYRKYDTRTVMDIDDVQVRNCVFWNALWGNALELGFELNGAEVRNVRFSNCDVIHVEAGAVLSIHNAGRSTVKDIVFEDIRIEDARQKLFDVAIFRSQYSEDGTRDPDERKRLYMQGAWDGVLIVPPDKKDYHAQFRGQVRNVVFRNIQIIDGLFPYSIFYGFDENHTVENVTIDNLTVRGQKITDLFRARIYTENAKKITLK